MPPIAPNRPPAPAPAPVRSQASPVGSRRTTQGVDDLLDSLAAVGLGATVGNDYFAEIAPRVVPAMHSRLVRPPRPTQRFATAVAAPPALPTFRLPMGTHTNGELVLGDAHRPLRAVFVSPTANTCGARALTQMLRHAADPAVVTGLLQNASGRPEVERMARYLAAQILLRRQELRAANQSGHAAYAPLLTMLARLLEAGLDLERSLVHSPRQQFRGTATQLAAYLHDAAALSLLLPARFERESTPAKTSNEQMQRQDLPWLALSSAWAAAAPAELRVTLGAWSAHAQRCFAALSPEGQDDGVLSYLLPPSSLRDVALLGEVLRFTGAVLRRNPDAAAALLHGMVDDAFVDGVDALLDAVPEVVSRRREGDWMVRPAFLVGPAALHLAAAQANEALWPEATQLVEGLVARGADALQLALPTLVDDVESLLLPRAPSHFALRVGNLALFARLEEVRRAQRTARRANGAEHHGRTALTTALDAVAQSVERAIARRGPLAAVGAAAGAAVTVALADGALAASVVRYQGLVLLSAAVDFANRAKGAPDDLQATGAQLLRATRELGQRIANEPEDGRDWAVMPAISVVVVHSAANPAPAARLYGALPALVASQEWSAALGLLAAPAPILAADENFAYALALRGSARARKQQDAPLVARHDLLLSAMHTRLCANAQALQNALAVALELADLCALRALLAEAAQAHVAWWKPAQAENSLPKLLAEAALVGPQAIRALLRYPPADSIVAALAVPDAQGDTPLHVAARRGGATVAPLLRACRTVGAEAHGQHNAEGRSPALEALTAGHVDAFHALAGPRRGRPTPQVLADVLAGRAGKLSSAALEAVAGLTDGPFLLRAAAPLLLRRLARRSEAASIKAVLRHLQRLDVAAAPSACVQGRLLHAVAQGDAHTVLATLRDVLGVQVLTELAASTNQDGQQPWQLSVSVQMQQALRALLPAAPKSTPPALPPRALSEAARLAARVRANDANDASREQQVLAFAHAARAALTACAGDVASRRKVHRLAWNVVEQLAAVVEDVGAGMGMHYGAHRPGQAEDVLVARADALGLVGSSCFGQEDGVTLLELRARALLQAREAFAAPLRNEARLVLDFAGRDLQAHGFTRPAPGAALRPFQGAASVRFVVRRGPSGPTLVTVYPRRP